MNCLRNLAWSWGLERGWRTYWMLEPRHGRWRIVIVPDPKGWIWGWQPDECWSSDGPIRHSRIWHFGPLHLEIEWHPSWASESKNMFEEG